MKPKCLETRLARNGLKYRRYRRPDGTDFKTVEVPIEVWLGLNTQGNSRDRLAQWLRARERDKRRAEAIERAKQRGWRTIAIAHDMGVPVRTIQRWIKSAT